MVNPEIPQYESLTPTLKTAIHEVIDCNFKGFVRYGFASGSVVFSGAIPGKSDIDIIAILDPSITSLSKDRRLDLVRSFVSDYLEVHRSFGFEPDLTFPGEYFTSDQVEDAIAGRGFQISEDGKLYLPRVYEGYYLEDPERWFRAWLAQSSYGEYVYGDTDLFEENKIRGWETVILFTLLTSEMTHADTTAVLKLITASGDKKSGLGIADRYITFSSTQKPYIDAALKRLQQLGFLDEQGNIDHQRLQTWQDDLSKKIRSGDIGQAEMFLDLKDTLNLEAFAKKKWKIITKH